MNDKSFSFILLLTILLTLVALVGHNFFPQRYMLLLPKPDTGYYIYSDKLPDGSQAATWIDERARQWRCTYPEGHPGVYFACSFNVVLQSSETQGIDLSRYSHVHVQIHYVGNSNKIRVHLRNFNPAYSKVKDYNSTKFNAINLSTKDLSQKLSINLNEFVVSDWWVSEYNLPHTLSRPDLSNVVTLGVDFADPLPPGNHDVTIEKIEFSGKWISREHWYLAIIGCWMLGIFIYALTRLVQLNHQTRKEFALAMAEKIRILIFDEIFEPDNPLNVTASFGIGDRLVDEDFASMFKRVDNALYNAKSQGRNCCVLAQDSV